MFCPARVSLPVRYGRVRVETENRGVPDATGIAWGVHGIRR
jgi:hypothetical protein